MKLTIDVDCTPEEARRFIGLPDLAPVHDLYVTKLTRMIEEGISQDMVDQMVRTWGPMSEAGLSMWRSMAERFGSVGKAP